MSEMRIIDKTGDTKIIWDKSKKAEVEQARNTFDELKNDGYIAYEVKDNGKPGEIIKRFNKDIEKMILRPPMAGG